MVQCFGSENPSSTETPKGTTKGCFLILSVEVSGGKSKVSMSASMGIVVCCSSVRTIGRDRSAQMLISPDGTFGSPW